MAKNEGAASSRPYFPCHQCVHCGEPQEENTQAVVWFSETSVTLAKCRYCEHRLDPYVELEFPLIALELMLHRVPAFRHVICNRVLSSSIWVRFAIVINFIEVLAHFWISRRDPTPGEVVQHLLQSLIVFMTSCLFAVAAYAVVTWTLPDKEMTILEMRALVVSRFPSVLLVIAMAWWFPSNFYAVIALYTTSTSFAAVRSLPGVDSNAQAAFVAICAAIPRVVKALPPGTLKIL